MSTTALNNIKKGYVDGPNGQIHYWSAGQGETLLLIHQSSSSSEEYARLIPHLSGTYHLVSYDWPGHGNSYDPDHELGVEEYTQSALVVLDALGIKQCSVLGHHGGALLAMNLGYLYPGRIKKVILSGTSGPKTKEESETFKNNLPIKRKHEMPKDGSVLMATWERFVGYMPNSEGLDILIPYLNTIKSKLRPYDAHFGVLGWDRNPALQGLKMPVLLLQGTLDFFVSRQELLLDIIPHSERKLLDGVGAFMFYENPELCAQVIHYFLAK